MRKIVVACNSGLGTSLMIRINLEAILRELNCGIAVEHTDVTSLRAYDAKLIVCSAHIYDSIEDAGPFEIIPLQHITDKQYLKNELLKSRTFQQWQAEMRSTL